MGRPKKYFGEETTTAATTTKRRANRAKATERKRKYTRRKTTEVVEQAEMVSIMVPAHLAYTIGVQVGRVLNA